MASLRTSDCRHQAWFFQSDQQFCEGRLVVTRLVPLPFFQSDQQCCEGRPYFFSVAQGVQTETLDNF
ncbi:unnamed protein product [Rodentolepis nana]|uniref:Uncharacterized protein n=1 Tax=Rodentolepis nana TaxID=102285 RepID=A0A0R3TCJ2_RODNA|nr:unnamed protein product [Rodentolepis nana]